MCSFFIVILMGIFGILILVSGKFFLLNRNRVVEGTPDYLIGIILMLPFPLTFAAFIALGLGLVGMKKPIDNKKKEGLENFLGMALILLCLLTAVLIALVPGFPSRPV